VTAPQAAVVDASNLSREPRGDVEGVTANTAVHAVCRERDVRSSRLCAIPGAEIFAHGVVAQPGPYGMRDAQRRRQKPRRRPSCGRNVAPRTASLGGDGAATRGCSRHTPSRYAFPRGPRMTGPETGPGPRVVGSPGLKGKRLVRAGFFGHGSLLTPALVSAWTAPASDPQHGSARRARALERERA
jgi:hypothetical protein